MTLSVTPTQLHLVELTCDAHAVAQIGLRRVRHANDDGYALHCLLREAFGDAAPQPFVALSTLHPEASGSSGRTVAVLGYSTCDENALRKSATAPEWLDAVQVQRGRRLPIEWPVGLQLGFTVRVCPTVRTKAVAPDASSTGRRHVATRDPRDGPAKEVDAYIVASWRRGTSAQTLSREEVYREWLSEALLRQGGARLLATQMTAFQLDQLLRRTQGDERKARSFFRPAAVLSGVLEVTDTRRFHELLVRGVGRHRAFGFGMLVLRAT